MPAGPVPHPTPHPGSPDPDPTRDSDTPAGLARRYGLPVVTLLRWRDRGGAAGKEGLRVPWIPASQWRMGGPS